MRKYLILAILAIILLSAQSFAAETIKIGQIASLTGDFTDYGQMEVNGAKLAIDEINANGGILGKKAELAVYDSKGSSSETINAVRLLTLKEHVSVIIGPGTSNLCIAAAPIVAKMKTPLVSLLATNTGVTVDKFGHVRPYSFRIGFTDPYQGKILALFAAKELKAVKAAVLLEESDEYSIGLSNFFEINFVAGGGTIVASESFRHSDIDITTQLSKIQNSSADVLVIPVVGRNLPLAVKKARDMGIAVPILCGDGYGEYVTESAGTDATKSTYWVSHGSIKEPRYKNFVSKYEAVTKKECKEGMNAIAAYDSVYWIKNAIERAGSSKPEHLRSALETTNNLHLIHLNLTMTSSHDPLNKGAVIMKAVNGKSVFVKKVKP